MSQKRVMKKRKYSEASGSIKNVSNNVRKVCRKIGENLRYQKSVKKVSNGVSENQKGVENVCQKYGEIIPLSEIWGIICAIRKVSNKYKSVQIVSNGVPRVSSGPHPKPSMCF